MKKLLASLFSLAVLTVSAQLPQEVWETGTYLDGSNVTVNRFRKDQSGNLYSVGSVYNASTTDRDLYISKNDANGNVIFSDTYDSGQGTDEAIDVFTDNSGNIYVVGNTRNGGSIFARKYSSTGTVLYTNEYQGAIVSSKAQDADLRRTTGDLYITGRVTNAVSGEGVNMMLIKYLSDGTMDWIVDYDGGGAGQNNDYDTGYKVEVDGSGNAYVLGVEEATWVSNSFISGGDAFIRKYTSAGAYVWTRVPSTDGGDSKSTLAMETSANVVVYDWDRKQSYQTATGVLNPTIYFDNVFNLTSGVSYNKMSDGGYVRVNANAVQRFDSDGNELATASSGISGFTTVIPYGDDELYVLPYSQSGVGSIKKFNVSTSAISLAWTYTSPTGNSFEDFRLTENNTLTISSGTDSLDLHRICIPPDVVVTPANNFPGTPLCSGDTMFLSVNAEYADGYSWFGNGFGPNADTIFTGIPVATNTTIHLNVEIDAGNGCIVSQDFSPFLNFKFIEAYIVSAFEGDCENDPGLLFSLVDANFYEYNWYFNDVQQTFNASSDTMLLMPGNGTYTMEVYDTQTGCLSIPSPTYEVTGLMPADDPSFSYSQAQFCGLGIDPTPTITGTAGGFFTSSPNGLVINANSGVIDLSASAENTYAVQYTTNGACVDSVVQIVNVINCCGNPNTYSVSNIQFEEVTLSWNAINYATAYNVKVREVGGSWTYHAVTDTFKVKANLTSGTDYEWKVKTVCDLNSPNGYGDMQYFTTAVAPPCPNPNTYSVSDIQADTVTLHWNTVAAATKYKVKVRPVGGSWTYHTVFAPDTFKVKGNLSSSTNYEWKVKTICAYNTPGSYGPIQYFATAAGQDCNNPTVYSETDIQSDAATISWNPQPNAIKYKLKIRPVGTNNWTYHTILLPDTFKVKTNLLVATDYEYKVKTVCNVNTPGSYGPIQYFATSAACANPTIYSTTDIMAYNATMNWNAMPLAIEYQLKIRAVGAGSWTYITLADTFKIKNGLTSATDYEWKVKTVCNANTPGGYGALQNFVTAAPPRLSDPANGPNETAYISIYPNPTNGQIQIDLGETLTTLTINVYSPLGVLVQTKQLQKVRNLTHQLPEVKGIYLIQLVNEQGVVKTVRIAKH